MQQEAQQDQPQDQQTPLPPQGRNRNPTQGHPPARRNPALDARNRAAAEYLRQQRGVEAVESKQESKQEKPQEPPPNPVVATKPTPDMIAAAKAEREEAQRLRDEALAAQKATQERLNGLKDDPIGFLAELGMTEEDWKKFNATGGIPPQVSKALRELQETKTQFEKRLAETEARAKKAEEDRDIGAILPKYPLVRKCGGAEAARAHAAALKQAGMQPGSWAEVLESFESQLRSGVSDILDDFEINSKYGFKSQPNQHAKPAEPPSTLGTRHVSSASYADANAQNPYAYGTKENLEWKRKRAQAIFKGAIK